MRTNETKKDRRWTAALLPRVFLFADAAVRALMTGVKYQLDRHSTFAENVLGSCLAVESFLFFFFFALATSLQGILFFFALKCYTRRTLTIVESTEKI